MDLLYDLQKSEILIWLSPFLLNGVSIESSPMARAPGALHFGSGLSSIILVETQMKEFRSSGGVHWYFGANSCKSLCHARFAWDQE